MAQSLVNRLGTHAHPSIVTCLAIGENSGEIMVTGGKDGKVFLWLVGREKPTMVLPGLKTPVSCMTLDPKEQICVAGSEDGTVKLWDLNHAKAIRTLNNKNVCVNCVDFHPFGEFFASGGADATLKIWDIKKTSCIQTYSGHRDQIMDLHISPDGRWISTTSLDGTTKLWDITAGKLLHTFPGNSSGHPHVQFHPRTVIACCTGPENTLNVWNAVSFEQVSSIQVEQRQDTTDMFFSFIQSQAKDFDALFYTTSKQLNWVDPYSGKFLNSVAFPYGNIKDIKYNQNDYITMASVDHNFVYTWNVELQDIISKPKVEGSYFRPENNIYQNVQHEARPESPFTVENKRERRMTPQNGISNRGYNQRNQLEEVNPVEFQSLSLGTTLPLEQDWTFQENSERNSTRAGLKQPKSQGFEINDESTSMKRSTSSIVLNKEDKVTFIPSCGQKALGVPLTMFLEDPSIDVSNLLSPVLEDDESSEITSIHPVVISVLSKRLHNISLLKREWDLNGCPGSVQLASSIRDKGASHDLIKLLTAKPKLLTLGLCVQLLPLVDEILQSGYEDYIETACNIIKEIMKNFSTIIQTNLNTEGINSPGVDIIREERIERCRACYRELMSVKLHLKMLRKGPGRISRLSSDCLIYFEDFSLR